MRWAIGISIALHLLMLTLVFRGSHIDKKAYPPVMMVHLSSPPPLLGVQNPAVEQAAPVVSQQKKVTPIKKEETHVAEVNPQKRPKRPEQKPPPSNEEQTKVSTSESKSKGLPEGVQLGSEFGFAQLDATGFDSPIYLNVLFLKIRNAWENPYEGPNKIQCTIYFVISRDGKIIDSFVEKSSGIEAFDQSVLRAVLNCNPPPLPPQFGSDELGVHLGVQCLPGM